MTPPPTPFQPSLCLRGCHPFTCCVGLPVFVKKHTHTHPPLGCHPSGLGCWLHSQCTQVAAWLCVGTQQILLQLVGTDTPWRDTGYKQARKPKQRCSPQLLLKMDDLESEFNLKVVLVCFKQCLNEKEEVLLEYYLDGWRGLVRFLNSLGTIFSFISKDVVTKLQIMDQLRSGPQQEHYSSLQAMVAYEVGNQLVDLERRSRHPDSGCRTVLRLHRALHWLQLFLEGVRTSPEDARTSALCTDSYNASLATYHPWIIRRAVTVAFCALPTRKVFLESMNVGSSQQAVEMLDEALPFIERVYNISQKLYAEHALLDLP
ncbi:ceramide-1-phosphate transfer protein isoform X1 [Odocoileus virginianus]|uniref:Ceramide-1-phosphate transfer protein n=2 Tax=Odocoileus virginianus TaxID=9874 RepID=A0ABM4IQY0_ODOVR